MPLLCVSRHTCTTWKSTKPLSSSTKQATAAGLLRRPWSPFRCPNPTCLTPLGSSKRPTASMTNPSQGTWGQCAPRGWWKPLRWRSTATTRRGISGTWHLRLVWIVRWWGRLCERTLGSSPTIYRSGSSSAMQRWRRDWRGPRYSAIGSSLVRRSPSFGQMRRFLLLRLPSTATMTAFWPRTLQRFPWRTGQSSGTRSRPPLWWGRVSPHAGRRRPPPLIFLLEGVNVTQKVYLNMLSRQVLPWIKEQQWDGSYCFQQDRAPSQSGYAEHFLTK